MFDMGYNPFFAHPLREAPARTEGRTIALQLREWPTEEAARARFVVPLDRVAGSREEENMTRITIR